MLTVRFIGFFSIFRKGNMTANIAAGALGIAVIFMALFALCLPVAAQSGDEEEPAMIYHGRDMEGNRIFGTEHRAAPSFYTDPESGDRRFQTPPPDPSASSNGNGPEYIFVAPEVYPGDYWQNGQRPPGNKPGGRPDYRPGNRPGGKPDGSSPPNRPSRRSLGPPPGGYPPTYDRPPTGGASFIPRSPVWEGSRR